MVPFFKAVCVYFVLDAHNQDGEYWTTILKCAPIVALIVFILLQRMDITKRYQILLGFFFFLQVILQLLSHDWHIKNNETRTHTHKNLNTQFYFYCCCLKKIGFRTRTTF